MKYGAASIPSSRIIRMMFGFSSFGRVSDGDPQEDKVLATIKRLRASACLATFQFRSMDMNKLNYPELDKLRDTAPDV